MFRNNIWLIYVIYAIFFCSCSSNQNRLNESSDPFVVVLGVAQDGGYPQAGTKTNAAWEDYSKRRYVVCLGIADPKSSQRWMIDATPDFKEQLHVFDKLFPVDDTPGLAGIFLTHAHIGHYTGLINLGREVIGAKNVPVFAMPKMYDFIQNNGPWDLLVKLENINLFRIKADSSIRLNDRLSIEPILVPHRAEYTETVGYKIIGPNKTVLFIPDIDKWKDLDAWGVKIEDLIAGVDYAFLDGTFYDDGEIPGRSMTDIPHPFIEESLSRFHDLPPGEKRKIFFIHFNRSNPVVANQKDVTNVILKQHYNIARQFQIVTL